MKWKRLTIETTTEALDYLGAIAEDLSLEGFEIEDNVPLSEEDKKKMFIDILPELPPDEGVAKVSFYVDTETDMDELCNNIMEEVSFYTELCDFGSMKFSVSETEDKDWINNWKEFFKPFRVDDSIIIKPTWETLADDQKKNGDMVIEIDPGTAFGTGAHETTKLCILNLKKYLKEGEKLLDVGCGSGILSIVGMKLGACEAVGIDIDDNASHISVENADVNGIPVVFTEAKQEKKLERLNKGICFMTGNVIDDRELREFIGLNEYDVVVANILADIIIPLSKVAGEFMKKGARFISSGIINTKEEQVKEALLKNGFKIEEVTHMNDWVSIVAVLGDQD